MGNEKAKKKLWIYSTLALLIICGALLSLLALKNQRAKKIDNETRFIALIPPYLTLTRTQINLYEFIGRSESDDFKKYFPEYSSISKEELENRIRENIVSLKMRAERLGGAPNSRDQQDYKSLKQSYAELIRTQARIFEFLLNSNVDLQPFFSKFENLSKPYYAEVMLRQLSDIDLIVMKVDSKMDFDRKRERDSFKEDMKREVIRLRIELESLGVNAE